MLIGGIERSFRAAPRGRVSFAFTRPSAEMVAEFLPPVVAPIRTVPRDRDQGSLQSCVEFSIAEQYEHLTGVRFSPLFGFFFARTGEGDKPTENVGLSIPDAVQVAQLQGMCREETWPYDPASFAVAPPVGAIIEARMHRAIKVDPIADLLHVKECIASGQPVLLGVDLPDTIDSAQTASDGIVLYTPSSQLIGRHAVNAIAYDDNRRLVGCTSHWGAGWGDHGLLWIPFAAWDMDNVSDAFAIRAVAGVAALAA